SQQLQPIAAQNAASIASDIAINIAGALVAIGSILPALRANGRGSVLLSGGGLGKQPSADLLTSSVGKAAIDAIACALFEALRAQGIHVAVATVSTLVAADSRESREVAARFWQLYETPRDAWLGESAHP
ncbi:MAG: hypothetical protein ABW187_07870, partial [Dokdonella sp.]